MKTNLLALSLVASITSAASSAVVTFSDLADWRSAAGLPGLDTYSGANLFSAWSTAEHIEDFSSLAVQTTVAGGSISNGTGTWWNWSATNASAAGSVGIGNFPSGNTLFASPTGTSLRFNFSAGTPGGGIVSGVHGFGGNFSFFSASGSDQNGRLVIALSTGESIVRNFGGADPFAGFWLTDTTATITSVTVTPFGNAPAGMIVGAHSLHIGYAGATPIPAPGAIALLGAAGFIASNRRRD